MADVNWLGIKNEYISTKISFRKLADKYGVSPNTLTKRAVKEKWRSQREAQDEKVTAAVQQKTADVLIKKEIDRIEKITSIADKLTDKIEQAILELGKHVVSNEIKTKTTAKAKGGAVIETTIGSKSIDILQGLINPNGIKQLTAALKDVNEIQKNYLGGETDVETDPLTKSLEDLAKEIEND